MTTQIIRLSTLPLIVTKKIKISREYSSLVPDMGKEEDQTFDQSIKINGVRESLKLNQNNVLLDGHHRYKKARKYNIKKVPYERKEFENKLLEKKYVIECNLERRHLNNFQKVKLGLALLAIEQKLGHVRKISKLRHSKVKLASEEANEKKGKSALIVAKKAGVSTSTLERGKYVSENADKETLKKLESGEMEIGDAYKQLRKEKKKNDREESLKKVQVQLPKSVQLHNKPFQELELEAGTVSLIFTDPPYDEDSLYLYKDLAKQASKVLRDGGSVMCYAGHYAIDRIIDYMKSEGLHYHWIIAVIHSGASASVFGKKILVGYKPILWFTKGTYQGNFVKDVIKSEFQGKELHEWAQSTIESDYYIKYLTIENEIVYDPFLGQGTFGISAVKLNRQFIGAEKNKEHFTNAQKLITIANNGTKK